MRRPTQRPAALHSVSCRRLLMLRVHRAPGTPAVRLHNGQLLLTPCSCAPPRINCHCEPLKCQTGSVVPPCPNQPAQQKLNVLLMLSCAKRSTLAQNLEPSSSAAVQAMHAVHK